MSKKSRKGWHCTGDVLKHKDGRETKVGVRLEYLSNYSPGKLPGVCAPGMHATGSLKYALTYARQRPENDATERERREERIYLTRVLVEEIFGFDRKKFSGRYRTILWKRRIPKWLWNGKGNRPTDRYTHDWTRKGVAAVRAWAEANGALRHG